MTEEHPLPLCRVKLRTCCFIFSTCQGMAETRPATSAGNDIRDNKLWEEFIIQNHNYTLTENHWLIDMVAGTAFYS